MSDIFANVYGARFPDVVMNQGPLPSAGGLPAPLHDTPDAKINYNSTLLGDLQPYAYGEGAYQSSGAQNNTPHRIQKLIPQLHLPEPNGKDVFLLSHGIDDSDLAFVMRLNRNSVFCTGSRTSSRRTTNIGTSVDPLINLPTLNYLLAGLQVAMPLEPDATSLWWELLYNLDPGYWPNPSTGKRNYNPELCKQISRAQRPFPPHSFEYPEHRPITLEDLVHFIRKCVRPFGIVRGSEKQGGQHEMSNSPATWPVSAVCTLVVDGKEANVVNMWHSMDVNAGDDLVLRLKLMPLKTYTLNHYYKGFARRTFEAPRDAYVWQLVPDVLDLSISNKYPEELANLNFIPGCPGDQVDVIKTRRRLMGMLRDGPRRLNGLSILETQYTNWTHVQQTIVWIKDFIVPWQEIGYWHIGRSQIMTSKYGTSEYYNDDLANGLKTNHMDMTVQPVFASFPRISGMSCVQKIPVSVTPYRPLAKDRKEPPRAREWEPSLALERMHRPPAPKRAALEYRGDTHARPVPVWRPSVREPMGDTYARPVPTWMTSAGEPVRRAPPVPVWRPSSPMKDPEESGPVPVAAPASVPVVDSGVGVPPVDSGVPVISEASRQELLQGLGAPAVKKPGAKGRSKKPSEPSGASGEGARDPVEGTLLRPGGVPEACQMELL